MNVQSLSCIVLLACHVAVARGFLFDTCDAPPPCTCQVSGINCASLHLPRIPEFNLTQHYSTLYLYLQNNNVIVVPPDSFAGITSDRLYLDLSKNNIYDIHPLAFDGIEDKITILKLSNNHLRAIPVAIANLTRITSLDLHGNPITVFNRKVLEVIGNTLEIITMGSPEMKRWPNDLDILTRLRSLQLSNASIDTLPKHALIAFNATLQDLAIEGSQLTMIPDAICDLDNLNNFRFYNNTYATNDVIPSCETPLTSVTSLNIDRNDLSEFPDVFRVFPNLLSLSVTFNPNLTSLDGANISSVTEVSSVIGLYLQENDFSSVPSDLGSFSNLQTLDLSSNYITTVRETDFETLANLRELNLNNNPLYYINELAFSNLTALYQVSLDYTQLGALPEVIKCSGPKLHVIDYNFNNVNCTCDEMGWVRNWTGINNLDIRGTCASPNSGEPLQFYFSGLLSKC